MIWSIIKWRALMNISTVKLCKNITFICRNIFSKKLTKIKFPKNKVRLPQGSRLGSLLFVMYVYNLNILLPNAYLLFVMQAK